MPSFRCDLDITQAVSGLSELEKKHLPFATAATLTSSAKGAQQAVQSTVAPGATKPFTIRNNWTRQNIRVKAADKNTWPMHAVITADTSSGKAPDYLSLQSSGGEKVPHNGNVHIAVPSEYLIAMVGKTNVIPSELRARNLLGAVGGRYVVTRRAGRNKGQLALVNQKRVRGFEFFTQTVHGEDAILGRYFTDRQAYVFYWLVPEVRVRAAFPFETLCRNAVNASWRGIWEKVWSSIRIRGLRG